MKINHNFKYLLIIFFGFSISTWAEADENVNIQTCFPYSNLNECINSSKFGNVQLVPGIYLTDGIKLKSNLTLNIPQGAIIRLSDNAELNNKAFGGVANAVILAKGLQEKPLTNIHIILNGEIDGNKLAHPYEKGGSEAVNFAFVMNSSIRGSGVIHSANGDGIDIDASNNITIEDIIVKDNGGSGVHFGSPRPIYGSTNNIILNVKSYNNGFERKRNGLDLSWPNSNGATFINCTAVDNYRNYEIEAEGGIIVGSLSIDNGKVVKKDNFEGAEFVQINGIDITNKSWISKKHKILIKRDIKKLLNPIFNFKTPKYLDPIRY
jgi:polygalacturonase